MKIAFYTLGCKVNQYETQAMTEIMLKNGYEIADGSEIADVCVINSCTVTAESDRKTRQAIRRAKRKNPNIITVLTGCMPQAYPEDAERLDCADIVVGNKDYNKLPDIIDEYMLTGKRLYKVSEHSPDESFNLTPISDFKGYSRAFVKIQDGCNRFCSYCIIPQSRGRVRSKPLDELKNELMSLCEKNYPEIVLVGINLSSYGTDFGGEINICDAVELACSFENIKRVRLGSLEPDSITPEIIKRLSLQKKLCPHFHISLQSGCDETLKRMNRHYTSTEYKSLCDNLRNTFEDCAITTDVMVGFAGETEEEFEKSLDFVKEIGFERVHIFPYSVRKGTRAQSLGSQVQKSVKETRAAIMLEQTDKIRREFLKSQIGRRLQVLIETGKDGVYEGYCANYTPVIIKSDEDIRSTLVYVKISAASDDALIGETVKITPARCPPPL